MRAECEPRYCFYRFCLYVCSSVQCLYCVKTNACRQTFWHCDRGIILDFLAPPRLQNSKENPTAGALNISRWENFSKCRHHLISKTVRDRAIVTMEHYFEVIGSRSIRLSSNELEWPWWVKFFWQISIITPVRFDNWMWHGSTGGGSATFTSQGPGPQPPPNFWDPVHARTQSFCMVIKLDVRQIFSMVDHECLRVICLL